MRKLYLSLSIVITLMGFLASASNATEIHVSPKPQEMIFATWQGFEIDKLASIWLLKRFVAPGRAVIRFYPTGTMEMKGIAFDVPGARLRRYHSASTFETILKHYGIDDPKLVYMGKIIHDIEINIWQQKFIARTPEVQAALREIIEKGAGNNETVEEACRYLDGFYKGL